MARDFYSPLTYLTRNVNNICLVEPAETAEYDESAGTVEATVHSEPEASGPKPEQLVEEQAPDSPLSKVCQDDQPITRDKSSYDIKHDDDSEAVTTTLSLPQSEVADSSDHSDKYEDKGTRIELAMTCDDSDAVTTALSFPQSEVTDTSDQSAKYEDAETAGEMTVTTDHLKDVTSSLSLTQSEVADSSDYTANKYNKHKDAEMSAELAEPSDDSEAVKTALSLPKSEIVDSSDQIVKYEDTKTPTDTVGCD